ncbi:hypothetical protein QQS21_001988 [Conoideocrella luteorostrata]|uniref:Uncharacterized protein n=1 Tax=Conoideocrella luteorostrata TaxID=1105319 RepID=A0AAJ0CZ58_9HYPO|nr:hypothetical protein QQS21_001988 [Conoideocrella luteorostrata]
MATQDTRAPALDLRLFDEEYDEKFSDDYLVYKPILSNLIQEIISPSQAASQIDEWVTRDADTRLGRVERGEVIEEAEESEWLTWPNPARHLMMIFRSVAEVCSAFPPAHATQDALIAFIHALSQLPKHHVPCYSSDMSHQTFIDKTYTLWPIGGEFFTGSLAQQFRDEADKMSYPFSDVETPGSEVQIRWRNFQAFIARLTTSGLVDCSDSAALYNILTSAYTYPDLEERRIGGPNRIAGDLMAASQWLASDQMRKWLYEQCKAEGGEGVHKIWTMQNWQNWRNQMSFIQGDERFGAEIRALAESLAEKMAQE